MVHALGHLGGPLRSSPLQRVIVLSRATSATKIGVANLVHSRADVHSPIKHQRDHHERTVVAIQNRDVVGGMGFHFFGHFARKLRKFSSSSAIVTCVSGWRLFSNQKAIADDSSDRRLTGRFFTVTQDLAQKRPQHDRCVVHAAHSKQSVVLFKDSVGRKQTGERQSGLSNKRIDHTLKTGDVWRSLIWYERVHEKPYLAIVERENQEGFQDHFQGEANNTTSITATAI